MNRQSAQEGRRTEPLLLRYSLIVLAVGAAVAVGAFALTYSVADSADKPRFDVAIKVATAAAALVAGLLTWSRLELSRYEHRLAIDRDLTDRYSRSVGQLGSDDELVRVGGVFALERFAIDASRHDSTNDVDWRMALDMLATFARNRSRNFAVAAEDQAPSTLHMEGPNEVAEAVRVLGRFRRRTGVPGDLAYELRGVHLGRANLGDSNLAGADLSFGQFYGVNLVNAHLPGADLTGAHVENAHLTSACLTHANLSAVDLQGANLTDATLAGANLTEAQLAETTLRSANLSGAVLTTADLPCADLSGANLVGADLSGAILSSGRLTTEYTERPAADLTNANLTRAILTDADLRGADLTGATGLPETNLDGVLYDRHTRWPDGFTPPNGLQEVSVVAEDGDDDSDS